MYYIYIYIYTACVYAHIYLHIVRIYILHEWTSKKLYFKTNIDLSLLDYLISISNSNYYNLFKLKKKSLKNT